MSNYRKFEKTDDNNINDDKIGNPNETCAQTENVVSIETTNTQTDFYQILGINEEASYDEIKKKWLKLSLIYHPDKCNGNDDMFRKINLAYKTLSNPENRKKYNDSLAKTFDQLKETQRDTGYHVNEEFMRNDKENPGFDREKFLETFENKRNQFKELNEINVITEKEADALPKNNANDMYKLMAARDNELEQFRQELRTDMFDPRRNNEEFNYIFNQFRHMTRTDLEESENANSIFSEKVDPSCKLEFAPVSFDYKSISDTRNLINSLTTDFNQQYGDRFDQQPVPIVTSQSKTPLSKLEELIAQRKLDTQEIEDKFKQNAINTIDDSNKLVMTSELLEVSKEELESE